MPAAAPAGSYPACGNEAAIAIQLFNRLQHRWIAYRKICRLEQYSKPALAIEADKFLFDLGLCQLFFRNAGFKLSLGFFELLQPLLGGTSEDSGLNRVEHILDTRFRIPELLLIEGKIGVLPVLQLHNLGDDGFHGGIIPDKLHGLVDHQIFQPLFADGLFLAALVLFAVAHSQNGGRH